MIFAQALAIYNPTDAPAKSDALLGDWYQINAPEFPGDRGVDEEGNRLYTLGQGTFGVFEPKELVCAMGKARNPFVRRKDSSGVVDYTVEIPISFKDAEGRPAAGTLVNEAQCEVISDDRLGVKFTGGYLCPKSARRRHEPRRVRGAERPRRLPQAPSRRRRGAPPGVGGRRRRKLRLQHRPRLQHGLQDLVLDLRVDPHRIPTV